LIDDVVDHHSDDPIVTVSTLKIIEKSLKNCTPEEFQGKVSILQDLKDSTIKL